MTLVFAVSVVVLVALTALSVEISERRAARCRADDHRRLMREIRRHP